MSDVEWISIDGQIIRRDPDSDAYYATLIIRPSAIKDEERAAALFRQMRAIAPPEPIEVRS